MRVIAVDPSGNFHEGKGVTGIAVITDGYPTLLTDVRAEDYDSAPEYWRIILERIFFLDPDVVVIEEYPLYSHKANSQSWSRLETPQLIGCLRLGLHLKNIPVVFQRAADVKNRWNDDILVRKGFLERKGNRLLFDGVPTNPHKRDALRHGIHYIRRQERQK